MKQQRAEKSVRLFYNRHKTGVNMDESLKIIIGTLSGFIVAIFTEPIKRKIENKSKLRNLRIALYKEMIQNFFMLEQALQEYKNDNNSNIMVGQPLLIVDCYRYVVSQETALYYQLSEARLINMFYKLVDMLIGIPEGEKKFRTVPAKDIIESIVGLVRGGLDTGILNKKLAEKVVSKQEIENILKGLGKNKEKQK
jgi:hypothetical protein